MSKKRKQLVQVFRVTKKGNLRMSWRRKKVTRKVHSE